MNPPRSHGRRTFAHHLGHLRDGEALGGDKDAAAVVVLGVLEHLGDDRAEVVDVERADRRLGRVDREGEDVRAVRLALRLRERAAEVLPVEARVDERHRVEAVLLAQLAQTVLDLVLAGEVLHLVLAVRDALRVHQRANV